MGSRQSVVQHPRQRSQSHASTSALNGHGHQGTPGPSTSGTQHANAGSYARRPNRQVRSQSVVMPVFSPGGSTSGDSSGDDDVVTAAVVDPTSPSTSGGSTTRRTPNAAASGAGTNSTAGTGLPALDRLLRLNAAFANSGILVNRVPFRFFDIKCPVCHKIVPSDDVEYHLVVCLTRPRLTYNEDILAEDKGECPICFEEMCKGDSIARLPCLCVYHKGCIDSWFKVKNSCPEHPSDD